MEKKTDLRIVKTYAALTRAFIELVNEKLPEDITINELCERAIIRRTTFYKHFADKFEFMAFIIRDFMQKNIKLLDILKPNEPREFYEAIINEGIDEMERNERLVLNVTKSALLPFFMDVFAEYIAIVLEENFEEIKKLGAALPAEPAFLAQISTGALVQGAKWWVTQSDRIDNEKMKRQLLQMILMINEMVSSGHGFQYERA